MMKKMIALMLVLSLVLCMVGGCATTTQPATPTAPVEDEGETFLFTDSCGREVLLPKNLTRVAPCGTTAQMILYSLAPDSMIGWSTALLDNTKQYIDEAYWSLPEFGQFYGKNVSLNLEALLAAKPQVIIDLGDMKASHKEDMDGIQAQTGIPTIFIEATLDTFPEAYRTLGTLLGAEEQAENIATYMEETVAMAKEYAATIPEEEKTSVYFGTGATGLDCNARGSIHADVIELVGAVNAAVVEEVSDKSGGNTISMEQLMLFAPDVILLSGDGGAYPTIEEDATWNTLTAVQEGRYYEIPYEPYNWMGNPPSVNRILGIRWLGNLLYPELYDYDMVEETRTFYRLFFRYDLTAEEASALLANSTLKSYNQ